ncbi:MAG: helicase-associated domain-containing protein [Lacisediminihabitans sp.]
MSNTLSLATRLRAMSDSELAKALTARSLGVSGIKDFFDLAEAFLDRASIQQMLTRLERETLAVLAAVGQLSEETGPPTAADAAARLAALAGAAPSAAPSIESIAERTALAAKLLLLETESGRYVLYDGVRDQLRSWPAFGLPGLIQLANAVPPAVLEPVPDVDHRFIDRLAADRAFAATTAITELLAEIEREPARELSRGGIALPDSKRLANAMSVDLKTVAAYLAVADRAALVARAAGSWLITELGGSWLRESSGRRWGVLAAAWFAELPGDIRQLLGEHTHALWGPGLRGFIDWLYPAGGDWMDERIIASTRDAELLGITANQAPSRPGTLLLTEGIEAAQAAMAALLPPEVEQVYLQHDLSVVAPGPLTPRVDARLRAMADVESRALASTYRVSTSSVNRAMAVGETAESMLSFLSSISLTGIPQPLEYLIGEASKRYGLIRAGELSGDDPVPDGLEFAARSYLSSDDTGLLAAIVVDQNLSALTLRQVAIDRVVSRFPLEVVFWVVSEARYPVAAEDSTGKVIVLQRRRTARTASVGTRDSIGELIQRLRLGGEPEAEETGQAWLLRQLDAAIRARIALTVSVTMPNGSIIDYQLEPTSIAGGRLRGRDRKSAIERTLPLSSIASLGPAI